MFSPVLPNVTIDVEEDHEIDLADTWSGTPDADDIEWEVFITSSKVGAVLLGTVLTLTGLGSTEGEDNDRISVTVYDSHNGDDYVFYATVNSRVDDVRGHNLNYGQTRPVFLSFREHWELTFNWETYFDPDNNSGFSLSAATSGVYTRTSPTSISDDVVYTFTGNGQAIIQATAGGVTLGRSDVAILDGGENTDGNRLSLEEFENAPVSLSPDMEIEIQLKYYDYGLTDDAEHERLEFSFESEGDPRIVSAVIINTDGDQRLTITTSERFGFTTLKVTVTDPDQSGLEVTKFDVPVYSYAYDGWRPSDNYLDLFGVAPEFIADGVADLTGIDSTDLFEDTDYEELVRFEGYVTNTRVIGNKVEIEVADVISLSAIPEEVLGANTGGPFGLLKNTTNNEILIGWPVTVVEQ